MGLVVDGCAALSAEGVVCLSAQWITMGLIYIALLKLKRKIRCSENRSVYG